MSVVNKQKILELALNNNLLGSEYKEDNIHGCSYDLRIGTIFRRIDNSHENIISVARNNDRIIEIKPSEIVTMLTLEKVTLPNNICGTVFPINKQSSQGLLILNPGHIDPGFSGPISICAINLSNEIKRLNLKDNIFTIIFDTLTEPTETYDKNSNAERIDYENNFYKTRASKLSPSIFDLITINEYIPHLREQINYVLKEKTSKFLKIFFGFIVGAATIIATLTVIGNYSDKKSKTLENEIFLQKETNKAIKDSLYFYKLRLQEIESNKGLNEETKK